MRHGWRGLSLLGCVLFAASCGDQGAPLPITASPSPAVTPSPTPAPVPEGQPQVVWVPRAPAIQAGVAPVPYLSLLGQSVSSDSLGWWRLDGQLTNSGQAPARHVIVLVRFFDASQSLVTTRPAIVQPTYAEPGQVLPFSLTWPPDPRIVTLTLWPDWVDPAPDP